MAGLAPAILPSRDGGRRMECFRTRHTAPMIVWPHTYPDATLRAVASRRENDNFSARISPKTTDRLFSCALSIFEDTLQKD